MQIRMHFNDGLADEALRSYVDRRLRLALARFGRRVGEINVRIRPDGLLESIVGSVRKFCRSEKSRSSKPTPIFLRLLIVRPARSDDSLAVS